jgi:hypothetical protein
MIRASIKRGSPTMMGLETDVREDVLLQVYPRGDLNEFEPARCELEHSPFSHLDQWLTRAGGVFAAEGLLPPRQRSPPCP